MDNQSEQEMSSKFSKSCKEFKKKKSLGFFILTLDPETKELKHREIIRVVNPKEGEHYIIPRPLDKLDFHISYHKTGQFHWWINEKHQFPKERKEDFCAAFLQHLKLQSLFGWIIGYCIAYGPKVKKKSLKRMLEILAQYVPISGLGSQETCDYIYKRKHVTQWNHYIKSQKDIKEIPLASGLMLVELKESLGILHTINFTFTSDNKILYHRMNWNPKTSEFEKKEISFGEIADSHFVLM